MAPTFVASAVSIIMAFQSLVGLDFVSEQWTAFIVVIMGIISAVRQYTTGRSTLLGGRPDGFR